MKPENSSLRWSRILGRFKNRRGSTRRRMKVQWQVTRTSEFGVTSQDGPHRGLTWDQDSAYFGSGSLLPGTRKIQTSRDDIIDVFDFSSAGHPSVAIKLFLGVGTVLILQLLKWRIQPQDEPGRGVIKRDLPESGQAGADEPSAEPLLGWSFHRRTSNLLPRSTSPPDQRRRRAVRRVGGRLVLASQQLPTRLPALPMGANIDYTFVH